IPGVGICDLRLTDILLPSFPMQTLAMSYLTGTIASYYNTKSVFLCLGITALVCLGVTIFCFQTKVTGPGRGWG
ncbi:hypothetical protein scyTo_0025165, partial [Scyliorhinus torazame]|nr:hypothetical protein [Scyliorhinus torazame]